MGLIEDCFEEVRLSFSEPTRSVIFYNKYKYLDELKIILNLASQIQRNEGVKLLDVGGEWVLM